MFVYVSYVRHVVTIVHNVFFVFGSRSELSVRSKIKLCILYERKYIYTKDHLDLNIIVVFGVVGFVVEYRQKRRVLDKSLSCFEKLKKISKIESSSRSKSIVLVTGFTFIERLIKWPNQGSA